MFLKCEEEKQFSPLFKVKTKFFRCAYDVHNANNYIIRMSVKLIERLILLSF
jgi:hypothetical protein